MAIFTLEISDAGTGGGQGGHCPPPNIFQISEPYFNRRGQITSTYYYWYPKVFLLAALLEMG